MNAQAKLGVCYLGLHCGFINSFLVHAEKYIWKRASGKFRIMDMVEYVGSDEFIPMDTNIVYRCILHWFMLMGRGWYFFFL